MRQATAATTTTKSSSSDESSSLLIQNALAKSTHVQETIVEEEIAHLDALLDDAHALQVLRAKRWTELKQAQQSRRQYEAWGHGVYTDVSLLESTHTSDVAKRFFEICSQSPRVIVHFYRPSTHYSEVFHRHLTKLAPLHYETRFISINVEDCVDPRNNQSGASFLVDRLNIVVMPTLLLVKDRQSVHQIQGFAELGNTSDFTTSVLERKLAQYKVIDWNGEDELHDDQCDD